MADWNQARELAARYIADSGVSVFLTGKAGTGKTTFLKSLSSITRKRFVVLAPTGVAAMNAGGTTIHSFFQLPFCPYLPDVKDLVTEYQMDEHRKQLRKSKREIIKMLDLLVIDEISMVRADLLDAVDMMLRRYRRSSQPFGGVQILMLGDIQQLAPVVTESEQRYISQVYPTPFFFASKALSRLPYVTIELTKVYRQQDESFVELLNQIRDGHFSKETLAALNQRYIPGFDPPSEGYIRLTTHNYQSDNYNRRKLEELPGKPVVFRAEVKDDFPDTLMPADKELELKEGAQVMFIRNNFERGYYNGKVGLVVRLDDESVVVRCEDGTEIDVEGEVWENTQYEVNPTTAQIDAVVKGTFRQLPLKIAWSVTIHKSQGLTFDHVVIDIEQSFAYGQVYVALSRCTTLKGIVLTSPITPRAAFDCEAVRAFNSSIPPISQVSDMLPQSKEEYFYEVLFSVFSFQTFFIATDSLKRLFLTHFQPLFPKACTMLSELVMRDLSDLLSVNERFRVQLTQIRIKAAGDTAYPLIKERTGKAAAYYLERIGSVYEQIRPILDLEVDNKENQKLLKEAADEFSLAYRVKSAQLSQVKLAGFSVDGALSAKAEALAAPAEPAKTVKKLSAPDEPDAADKALVEALSNWRRLTAKEENVPAWMVFSQKVLYSLATFKPTSPERLKAIKGLGPKKISSYGQAIVDIISDYL